MKRNPYEENRQECLKAIEQMLKLSADLSVLSEELEGVQMTAYYPLLIDALEINSLITDLIYSVETEISFKKY